MEPNTFEHDLLLPNSIRLIRIQDQDALEELQIEMMVVQLDSLPAYEALSYRWDDESEREIIMANGCDMSVMRPVHNFLQYRRQNTNGHLLWIDSLCIDQTDVADKESQIPLMGKIFSQASHVTVWLGDLENVDMVEALIQSISSGSHQPYQITESNVRYRGDQSVWRGLATLLSHSWFTRIWVAQEVILASQVYCIFGGISMAWSSLVDLLSNLGPGMLEAEFSIRFPGEVLLMRSVNAGLSHATRLCVLRAQWQRSHQLSSAQVFDLGTSMHATRAHDKVYAVLGLLANAGSEALLRPDYELPVGEVFRRAAIYVLQSERPLSILPLAGCGLPREYPAPTWVPDLLRRQRAHLYMDSEAVFAAGTRLEAQIRINSTHAQSISVEGNLVDTIAEVSSFDWSSYQWVGPADNEIETLNCWRSWTKDFDELLERSPYLAQDDRTIEMIWKTCVWFPSRESTNDSDKMARCYRAFRWWLRQEIEEYPEDRKLISIFVEDKDLDVWPQNLQDTQEFLRNMGGTAVHNRVALTKTGRIAMVPPLTKAGDEVCILWGSHLPFLLRKPGDTEALYDTFDLVGYTYILDYMFGDFADETKGTTFRLV